MEAQTKQSRLSEPPGRWAPPNGTLGPSRAVRIPTSSIKIYELHLSNDSLEPLGLGGGVCCPASRHLYKRGLLFHGPAGRRASETTSRFCSRPSYRNTLFRGHGGLLVPQTESELRNTIFAIAPCALGANCHFIFPLSRAKGHSHLTSSQFGLPGMDILRRKHGCNGQLALSGANALIVRYRGPNHALQPTAPLRYAFDVDLG